MQIKDSFKKSGYRFILLFSVCSFMLWGCNDDNFEPQLPDLPTQPIVVLFDNDVHCAVDGYPKLVSLRKSCSSRTNYVSTVSCGDFASGG